MKLPSQTNSETHSLGFPLLTQPLPIENTMDLPLPEAQPLKMNPSLWHLPKWSMIGNVIQSSTRFALAHHLQPSPRCNNTLPSQQAFSYLLSCPLFQTSRQVIGRNSHLPTPKSKALEGSWAVQGNQASTESSRVGSLPGIDEELDENMRNQWMNKCDPLGT